VNSAATRSIRWAQAGLLVNAVLVLVKLIAGIVGHANALVADAVESSADIFSSLIVWMGLSIAVRPADEDHPYGHGKAEPLAAAVVSLMLLGAAVGISILSIREIVTPHHLPAPFTLFVERDGKRPMTGRRWWQRCWWRSMECELCGRQSPL
jgi:cation diffusion facilitator family transporter